MMQNLKLSLWAHAPARIVPLTVMSSPVFYGLSSLRLDRRGHPHALILSQTRWNTPHRTADIIRPTDPEAPPIPLEFAHIVPHVRGFEEADMRAIYDGAGLIQFQFNPLDHPGFKLEGREAQPSTEIHLFLAKGIKAVDA